MRKPVAAHSIREARTAWPKDESMALAEASPLQLLGYYLSTGYCTLTDALRRLRIDGLTADTNPDLPSQQIFEHAIVIGEEIEKGSMRIPDAKQASEVATG